MNTGILTKIKWGHQTTGGHNGTITLIAVRSQLKYIKVYRMNLSLSCVHDGEVCYITSEVTRNVTSEKPLQVLLVTVTSTLHVPPPDFA